MVHLTVDPLDEIVDQSARAGRGRHAAPARQDHARSAGAVARPGHPLQPRRMAARALAARLPRTRLDVAAKSAGRGDSKPVGAATRLLVVRGILTAVQTIRSSRFTTLVLDEFHERSIHADLAIALARQAWRARDDLRIVVMSATIESRTVSAFLDDCPVVAVPGRLHPVDLSYAPGQSVADAAAELMGSTAGHLLCFLPGAAEIRRAMNDLQVRLGGDVEIIPLHGSLDADAQDAALRPGTSRRRIIVATNIAETSLTVPGVTVVIDAGLHKVARHDAERGMTALNRSHTADSPTARRTARRLAPAWFACFGPRATACAHTRAGSTACLSSGAIE